MYSYNYNWRFGIDTTCGFVFIFIFTYIVHSFEFWMYLILFVCRERLQLSLAVRIPRCRDATSSSWVRATGSLSSKNVLFPVRLARRVDCTYGCIDLFCIFLLLLNFREVYVWLGAEPVEVCRPSRERNACMTDRDRDTGVVQFLRIPDWVIYFWT